MYRTVRAAGALGFAAAGVALLASPASAHVVPDKEEVPAGSYNSVTLAVGHGCEESPTREITVQVPEGINDVIPQIHPGWTINVAKAPLSAPVDDGHGGQLTERESEVTFTAAPGGELPDGFRDTFTIGFKTPETPGEYLFFKTIQRCTVGETAWIEEYTGGEGGDEPEHPAPVVKITEAAEEGGHDDSTATTMADDDDEQSPDTEAASATSDSDDDSDSATPIAIAGLVVGALGLAAGGVALARSRGNSGSGSASAS
jgi:periplasmic copper chaperone A